MSAGSPLAIPNSVQEANHSFLNARRALALPVVNGQPGLQTAEHLGKISDRWICTLWRRALPEQYNDAVSLHATGGYGRNELTFHSDIDVLIALHDPAVAAEEEFILAIERLMAWSRHSRIRLSHAVRTASQARQALDDDLRNAIALLDLRHLHGPETQPDSFDGQTVIDHLRDSDEGRGFVETLIDGLRRRIARQGQTVFLLEPDVKNGEGGLRDLNYLAWAARVRWRLDIRRDSNADVGWPPEQRASYCKLVDRLLALRNRLHLLRGRKHDRLTFREQEALMLLKEASPVDDIDAAYAVLDEARARAEAPPGDDPARAALYPAIESMMARYYRQARQISTTGERCLRRWALVDQSPTRHHGPFELRNGQIALGESAELTDRTLFDALIVADERDLLLDPRLETQMEARVADWPTGDDAPGELTQRCRKLLVDPRRTRRTSRRLLDLGILTCFVPEFEPLICHVQHDLYHVYTTDVHSLKCLEEGRSLLEAAPEEVEHRGFCEVARQIENTATFLLACLFHDIGKGRGGGHSERGAVMMESVGPRLGLNDRDTEQVVFLIRHHLDLSTASRRRDISDPEIIDELAELIGSVETLNQLTALTYCDMKTVGPEVMNDWNASLLMELHHRLLRALESVGPGEYDGVREKRRSQLLAAVEAGDRVGDEYLHDFIADLPIDHLINGAPDELLRQYETYCCAIDEDQKIAVSLRPLPDRGVTEVVVVSPDKPGTLARIAGAIASVGINIMAADIVTTEAGLALDIFHVAHFNPRAVPPTKPRPVDSDRRLERIRTQICDVLMGRIDVDETLARRRSEKRLAPRPVPEVTTEVRVDSEVSTHFAVIEVRAPDRLGLLYSIARSLADHRVNTRVSRIDSVGHQAIDTFYLEEWDGSPLTPERIEQIVASLNETLAT